MKNLIALSVLFIFLLSNSCKETPDTSVTTQVEPDYKTMIIQANQELLNKGNLDYADQVFSAEYANGNGPEMIKKFVGELRSAFPDLKVSIGQVLIDGNKVAWQRTHTGTHQGKFLGFEPTGMNTTWTTMIITEYDENGKIHKEWGTNDMVEQLLNNSKALESTESD